VLGSLAWTNPDGIVVTRNQQRLQVIRIAHQTVRGEGKGQRASLKLGCICRDADSYSQSLGKTPRTVKSI